MSIFKTHRGLSWHYEVSGVGDTVLMIHGLGASGNFWQVGPDGNSNFIIYNQSNTGVWLPTGGTGWNSSSDKRLKENIIPLKDALEKISAIEGVTYFWKDKNRNSDEQVGVLADDVQKVYPQ